ncbi:MAG: PHB depolymerase family esterase [Dehalococcoidia bacterium]
MRGRVGGRAVRTSVSRASWVVSGVLVALTWLAAGCTDAGGSAPTPASTAGQGRPTATATPAVTTATPIVATGDLLTRRPYRLVAPSSDGDAKPAPLILVLHGYGQGADYDTLGLDVLAEREGALVVHPEGSRDAVGRRFWNASPACCNFFEQAVDDIEYLRVVIDDVSARHAVDPRRVYVAGFSNGGFMAHRLACEMPNRIAAIVTAAGVNAADGEACGSGEPVAVLQVHGDADPVVHYLGGRFGAGTVPYPSVATSIEGWSERNGCAQEPEVRETVLDLAATLPGEETSVTRYEECAEGGAVELWTVHGGSHDIDFSSMFPDAVWSFMEEHARS